MSEEATAQSGAGSGSWGPGADATPVLDLLRAGEMGLKGRLPWSSNATFLASVSSSTGAEVLVIYKPAKGERPLWDFPGGLWRREVAAYHLACFLGWQIVPPTVARAEGPLGPGSVQLFMDCHFEEHYFTLLESREHHGALRRIAVFDIVANNADRKAGHCLLDKEGRIWAIDNGLCFHSEPKLRTVIWDFAGDSVAADLLDALGPLSLGERPHALEALLQPEEIAALVRRASALRRKGRFPAPKTEHHYPWPLI